MSDTVYYPALNNPGTPVPPSGVQDNNVISWLKAINDALQNIITGL